MANNTDKIFIRAIVVFAFFVCIKSSKVTVAPKTGIVGFGIKITMATIGTLPASLRNRPTRQNHIRH